MAFERKKIALALSLALGGGGAIVGAAPALAQDIRVEVTGSSIRRVDAETALPVTIVTREEIAQTGVNNVEQLLAMLPSTATLGGLGLTAGVGLTHLRPVVGLAARPRRQPHAGAGQRAPAGGLRRPR